MNTRTNSNDLLYRAEFLAVQLSKENDVPLEKITIRSAGSHVRGWKGDILNYEKHEDESGEDTYVIEAARDGIYQRLLNKSDPPGEEFEAALGALDCEFNLVRARIEESEQTDFVSGIRNVLGGSLDSGIQPDETREFLLSRLKMIHTITGDVEKTQIALREILQEDLHVRLSQTGHWIGSPGSVPSLGEALLGHDLVLGGRVRTHGPTLEIEIGVPAERLTEFLCGGPRREAIHSLCKYLMPVECHQVLSISTSNEGFLLSEQEWVGRLGFTTHLAAN